MTALNTLSRRADRAPSDRPVTGHRRLLWIAFALGVAVPLQTLVHHRAWGAWAVFYFLVAVFAARVLVVDYLLTALRRRRDPTNGQSAER
jgi:hypothetical protein